MGQKDSDGQIDLSPANDAGRLAPSPSASRSRWRYALVALSMVAIVVSGNSLSDSASATPETLAAPTRFNPTAAETALELSNRWANPAYSQQPWSTENELAIGLLTFRGNPTRTFHGSGPIGSSPKNLWQREIGCSNSPVAGVAKQWCGTGWTGQPIIFKSPSDSNKFWLAVGGYNRALNFYDPQTGETVYPNYETNDIIKGTPTADPDGYPLIYTGSRDNYFHMVALDRDEPVALFKIAPETERETKWNNDWDSSALILNDYLFVGGENSRFYIYKLNRSYDNEGLVAIDPVEVFSTQAWDQELLDDLGDEEVSIENSVAVSGNTVYFANSGGLVQGWSIKGLTRGEEPTRTFRYWVGDDVDASLVIDEDGYLYVASQYQRQTERSEELGQLIKLDPSATEDPLLWSAETRVGPNTGIWATPAIYENQVIVSTNEGRLLGFDTANGERLWDYKIDDRVWASPVVVGDKLLQVDCSGALTTLRLQPDGDWPRLLWTHQITANQGCIESTPAVWDGQIYVGSRDGKLYSVTTE